MDGTTIGFIALGATTIVSGIVQTVIFTYKAGRFSGKMEEKIDDLCSRVGRLEDIQNSKDKDLRRSQIPR